MDDWWKVLRHPLVACVTVVSTALVIIVLGYSMITGISGCIKLEHEYRMERYRR